jgi:hypothetical protein
MNKSASISKLADALSKAQAEMPVVKMNSQNPFLKNKYADLGAVIEASRPVLSKFNLSISQFPASDGDKIGVTSLLSHASGEWLEGTIYINSTDAKGLSVAQSAGVVISYLRRYAWASILGLYADEDNDGHEAVKVETTKPAKTHRQGLIERYGKLYTKAEGLKIPLIDFQLNEKMSDEEIEAQGVELKKLVDAKESK